MVRPCGGSDNILSPGLEKMFISLKLDKISLQQGRFPSIVGWFPLCISLFFPSKSLDFLARSFLFCLGLFYHIISNYSFSDWTFKITVTHIRPKCYKCNGCLRLEVLPIKSSYMYHTEVDQPSISGVIVYFQIRKSPYLQVYFWTADDS